MTSVANASGVASGVLTFERTGGSELRVVLWAEQAKALRDWLLIEFPISEKASEVADDRKWAGETNDRNASQGLPIATTDPNLPVYVNRKPTVIEVGRKRATSVAADPEPGSDRCDETLKAGEGLCLRCGKNQSAHRYTGNGFSRECWASDVREFEAASTIRDLRKDLVEANRVLRSCY